MHGRRHNLRLVGGEPYDDYSYELENQAALVGGISNWSCRPRMPAPEAKVYTAPTARPIPAQGNALGKKPQEMQRAESPLNIRRRRLIGLSALGLIWYWFPGAMPQAGMLWAFGALVRESLSGCHVLRTRDRWRLGFDLDLQATLPTSAKLSERQRRNPYQPRATPWVSSRKKCKGLKARSIFDDDD